MRFAFASRFNPLTLDLQGPIGVSNGPSINWGSLLRDWPLIRFMGEEVRIILPRPDGSFYRSCPHCLAEFDLRRRGRNRLTGRWSKTQLECPQDVGSKTQFDC